MDRVRCSKGIRWACQRTFCPKTVPNVQGIFEIATNERLYPERQPYCSANREPFAVLMIPAPSSIAACLRTVFVGVSLFP